MLDDEEATGGARNTTSSPLAPQTRFTSPEQPTLHNKSGIGKTGGITVVGGSEVLHLHTSPFSIPKYAYPEHHVAQVWYV